MRTFEIIIILVNLPLIYWLLFRSNRFPSWARFLPLLGAIIIAIHLIFEGNRWQMFPIYLLSFFFLLLVIIKHFPRSEQYFIQSKISSIVIGIISILLFSLSAVLGTLLPIFSLPELTGIYQVGTASYHWIDETREELYTEDPTDKREIMVQVWYPADQVENPQPNYYWQDYDEIMGPKLAKNEGLPEFIFSHFNLVKTNAMLDAPISRNNEKTFPVVMYAHGVGCARSWATNQMEELASHGYIVIALDRTYNTKVTVFPDGRIVPSKSPFKYVPWNSLSDSVKNAIMDDRIFIPAYYSNPDGTYKSVSFNDNLLKSKYDLANTDISFAINELEELNKKNSGSLFENKINLEQIGVMGFSSGGGIVEDISRRDKRIKSIIKLDSGAPDNNDLQQPILCILSEFPTLVRKPKIDWIKKYKDESAGQKIMVDFVVIKGTLHNNFTDGPLYSSVKAATSAGPIDPVYAHHIINTLIVSFFDKHLKGNEDISIAEVAKNFDEVYYDSVKNN